MSSYIEKRIRKAFPEDCKPDAANLTISRGQEELEDTAPFRDKPWSAVEAAILPRHHYAMFWFTPEAFHYYLPSFLMAALDSPQAIFAITLILLLKPDRNASKEGFARERWRQLSEVQVEILELWLRELLLLTPPDARGEFEDAIRVVNARYWWA